jgi:hypothetical protein
MKLTTISAAVVLMLPASPVIACSPAPSCWMEESPAYLRSVCQGYAKDGQTLKQIAKFVDEPHKVPAFAKACKKLGIHLRAG